MKKAIIIPMAMLLVLTATAQNKTITNEEIWKNGTFTSKAIYGLSSMKDGLHYTTLKNDTIFCYEYAKVSKPEIIISKNNLMDDGKPVAIDGYQFSEDETKILISTATEHIYRRSTRESYYIYNRKTQQLTLLTHLK